MSFQAQTSKQTINLSYGLKQPLADETTLLSFFRVRFFFHFYYFVLLSSLICLGDAIFVFNPVSVFALFSQSVKEHAICYGTIKH